MKNIFIVIFLVVYQSSCDKIRHTKFPDDFLFGVGTSAYQIEGGWDANGSIHNLLSDSAANTYCLVLGKGENIWDRFTHTNQDSIKDKSNGDIACDSYNKVEEDVALLKELGVNFYRFSLSWSRILPQGLLFQINPDGIRYYNKLIDLLLENNITPFVTLFHWDTPQALEYLGGFTNELMVNWFGEYARVAFENFGDRVKWWTTFNEPIQICLQGYGGLALAPGYNFSAVASYLCGHNLLKSHAEAYHIYSNEFRPTQNGRIGITLDAAWVYPFTDCKECVKDLEAVDRTLQFFFSWYADPIFSADGDYPKIMKTYIGERSKAEGFRKSRLPTFSQTEIERIKGTADFLGYNHYTSIVVEHVVYPDSDVPSFLKDFQIKITQRQNWTESAAPWLKVVPEGFSNILQWIKKKYGDIEIYITENGCADNEEINDYKRIEYFELYLAALLDAMYNHKVNVKGYTAWSLLDNFEWNAGYSVRFGLYHVNFNDTNLKRTPKESAKFIKRVFSSRTIEMNELAEYCLV